MKKSMTEEEFHRIYVRVSELVSKHLPKEVKMPSKGIPGKPTKDALVLCALYKYIMQPVSKLELTAIMHSFYPETNDVQQARHLAKQKGFWIESGTRGDGNLKPNEYMLVSIEETYPGWNGRREAFQGNFEQLKAEYDFRCATCGSKEGEPQFHNKGLTTRLQQGHMDPRIRTLENNTIPQCGECNRAYRDWFVFDRNGRVRDINPESDRNWNIQN